MESSTFLCHPVLFHQDHTTTHNLLTEEKMTIFILVLIMLIKQ